MDKKTLNIGFDAKRAYLNSTGLGNYSRRVIEEMMALHPEWRTTLFTTKTATRPELKELVDAGRAREVEPNGYWKLIGSAWRVRSGITEAIKCSGISLYHGLSNELPLDIAKAGVASVVTIHDVIYRRCPDNYSAIDRRIYDYKYGHSARNATRIVAISHRTADDVVEMYDVDPAKIDVIYQTCDPQFAAPVSDIVLEATRKEFGLPDKYIAMVGTVESRKNQMLAVVALPFVNPEIKLVIVGRGRGGYDEKVMRVAQKLGVADRIVRLPHVPFKSLPAIYRLSTMAAYVSRYEGFGLPVIEAISASKPVIAAKGSCLEEAGGGGALYVDPDDVSGFAEAVNQLAADASLCARMVEAGQRHIAELQSTPMAEALTATYLKSLRAYE